MSQMYRTVGKYKKQKKCETRQKNTKSATATRNPSFTHPFIELGSKQALLPLDNDVGDCLHLRYRYRHHHHDL